jgi:hypothetical protein
MHNALDSKTLLTMLAVVSSVGVKFNLGFDMSLFREPEMGDVRCMIFL